MVCRGLLHHVQYGPHSAIRYFVGYADSDVFYEGGYGLLSSDDCRLPTSCPILVLKTAQGTENE